MLAAGTLQDGAHQQGQEGDEDQALDALVRAHEERMDSQGPLGGAEAFLHPILTCEERQGGGPIQMEGIGGQGVAAIEGLRLSQVCSLDLKGQSQGLILTLQLNLDQRLGRVGLCEGGQALLDIGALFGAPRGERLLDGIKAVEQPFQGGLAFVFIQARFARALHDQDAVLEDLTVMDEGAGTPHPLIGLTAVVTSFDTLRAIAQEVPRQFHAAHTAEELINRRTVGQGPQVREVMAVTGRHRFGCHHFTITDQQWAQPPFRQFWS